MHIHKIGLFYGRHSAGIANGQQMVQWTFAVSDSPWAELRSLLRIAGWSLPAMVPYIIHSAHLDEKTVISLLRCRHQESQELQQPPDVNREAAIFCLHQQSYFLSPYGARSGSLKYFVCGAYPYPLTVGLTISTVIPRAAIIL